MCGFTDAINRMRDVRITREKGLTQKSPAIGEWFTSFLSPLVTSQVGFVYAAKPIENAVCCIYETIVSSDKEIHEKNMVFNEVIKVCFSLDSTYTRRVIANNVSIDDTLLVQ